jgi:urease accessory protein
MTIQPPSRIAGTTGTLRIEYARRDCRTIIARSHCTSPWHLFPPIYLDDTGAAYTLLLNPSGGLVGGDHLTIDLTVRAHAHAIVSTPSANRVYRSLAVPAVQTINVRIESKGLLEWLPEPTIPFAGSRFRQGIRVRLARGAGLVLWDAIASGRIARGERWDFASLENDVAITTRSTGSLRERVRLDHQAGPPAGIAGVWDYIGSLYIVGDAAPPDRWKTLEVEIGEALEGGLPGVLGGVSHPAVPGLVVKLAVRSAPVLAEALERLWTTVRATLWDLPPVSLRKY